MDEVRERLREAAAAHRPAKARMLARVERGIRSHEAHVPSRRIGPAPWLRVVGATLAVAAVVTVSGYAVGSVVHGDEPPLAPGARGTPRTSAPGASGTPRTSSTLPGPEPSQGRTTPPSEEAENDYLRGEGVVDPHSNPYWAQSDITVISRVPLTALTVELRIAQTGGVADAGNWRTLPAKDFTTSVREGKDGALVFRWQLKAGRTVPAGRHIFAGQYHHAAGSRDAKGDAYTAEADGGAGKAVVRGGFTPAR
ncbi:hypothetical protein AB0G85_32505 [Streptomyces sioyaensis]|uniref:hypothetical protein n=1 Tax=Streptomyces sioyaensis TaxID=67364 RepID=UPI0033FBEA00